MLGKLIVELLGMIGLTWVTVLCQLGTPCYLAPGVFVAIYIYAWRPRTFAHLNPSVSLAYFLWNCENESQAAERTMQFIAYLVTQVIGAVIGGVFAATAIRYTIDQPEISIAANFPFRAADLVDSPMEGAFIGIMTEGIATFFFILVMLRVVCFFENERNQFGELVIGIAYTMAFWASETYSGGGINPAAMAGVSVANDFLNPHVMQYIGSHFFVYYIGTLVGTLAAIGMHILLHYAKPPQTKEEIMREREDNINNRKYTEIFQKYTISVVESPNAPTNY